MASLLGYPLRKAAKYEMLSGGVRLSSLVGQPSPLHLTKSETVPLVTPREERESMELQYAHIGQRLLPININHRAREEMAVVRSKDVYARHLSQNGAAFHPKSKDLSIVSAKQEAAALAANEGVQNRFMPLQIAKPMASNWAPAVRGSGVRSTRQQLFQERLDGKGFGWKKKARSLWQQDIDTNGFRPRRYF